MEPERCDLPTARPQDNDVDGGRWKDQPDVTGDVTGVAWQLSRGGNRLALSTSAHPDQRLHRQSGRLRSDGHLVLYLGSPGHT